VDKLVMVMRVQSKLHDLGYYVGTIDGKFGPKTIDALKRYQEVQGYGVTGKMDDATLAGLGIVY
jgi:peptidoglycan hydrolase-like protein with peptidoglycan-binding domain